MIPHSLQADQERPLVKKWSANQKPKSLFILVAHVFWFDNRWLFVVWISPGSRSLSADSSRARRSIVNGGAARPGRCRRQYGEALATAMRRAAMGNWMSHCSSAAHCVQTVAVDVALVDVLSCVQLPPYRRPPHCFLRGILSLRCALSQNRRHVYSCRPATTNCQ